MNPIKFLLLALLISAAKSGHTQTPGNNPPLLYNQARIDAKALIGIWETKDSLKNRVEFVDSLFEIVMLPKYPMQPYFFFKDTSNKVAASGFFPNWPPFNCDLNLVDPRTLQITYSQLGTPAVTINYIKIK